MTDVGSADEAPPVIRRRLPLHRPRAGAVALAALLILITVMGYAIRAQPARYNEVLGLDEFYFFRVSKVFLDNGLILPETDVMRNYPFGDRQWDYRLQIALPAYLYVLLNPVLRMDWRPFALLYPAILGLVAVLAAYFAGRELFRNRWAGVFSAFFVAVLPGMLTRTAAGGIEKEASAFPFVFLSVWFFAQAYNRSSWRDGILAGVFTGLIGSVWGGVQYFYILYAIFGLILFFFNRETERTFRAVVPTILIGILIPQLQAFHPGLNSAGLGTSLGVAAIMIIRYAVERFKLLKQEQLPYLVPGLVIAGVAVLLVGAIVSDFFSSIIKNVSDILSLYGPQVTTVAESIGGDWNAVYSQVAPLYANHLLGGLAGPLLPNISLANLMAVWVLMFAGALLACVRLVLRRDWLMLLPLIWFVSGIFGVFYAIRLVYVLAPAAAFLAAGTLGFLLSRAGRYDWGSAATKYKLFAGIGALVLLVGLAHALAAPFVAVAGIGSGALLIVLGLALQKQGKGGVPQKIYARVTQNERKFSVLFIPVVLYLSFTLTVNAANGYAYTSALGPSINEIFYQAMNYLRTQTPQNSSVISWWDFGYWFQTVGERASIADGGGAGETSRKDLALWFTAPADNWSDWDWFIKNKLNVGYILMDYTLPGKFGAITKIQSDGQRVLGFVQFNPQPSNTYQRNNVTVTEYQAIGGPYTLLVPLRDGSIADSPQLVLSQGNIVGSSSYITRLCTVQGIVQLPVREPQIAGCLAISSMGLFLVSAETEPMIFTRLMFMDGAGLPIDKVFDNSLIKIYKVRYENESNPGAGIYV